MKPQTAIARALTDAELQDRRAHLKREIPLAMSLLDAYDREHRRRKRRASGEGIAARAAFALLIMMPAFASEAPPTAPAAQPELLLIEHTYDGTVERAGALIRWQYTGGRMLVEWSDTTTDGIFRSGFEVSP